MARLKFDCHLRFDSGFELSAQFEAGDGVTALFGPSGSGKTTILNLIAGAMRPRTGTIRLDSRTLVDTQSRVFLPPDRRRVGVVFQEALLFPHMTVRQNLLFGFQRRGARPMDVGRVAAVLEIAELFDRRPESLSGGQRQRVALGRALLRGPDLLLMDEPLAALDEALKDRILTYLERAVAEWHIPTVFVSHDRDDVGRFAERVIVVEAGRVFGAGPTGPMLNLVAKPSN
jgi:molybdate transport system ATP-binding protein